VLVIVLRRNESQIEACMAKRAPYLGWLKLSSHD